MTRISFALAALLAFSAVGFAQGAETGGGRRTSAQHESFCPEDDGGESASESGPDAAADDSTRRETCTPLMRAAERGRAEAVRALISEGADVNAKPYHGETALSLATDAGREETVEILKRAGAKQ